MYIGTRDTDDSADSNTAFIAMAIGRSRLTESIDYRAEIAPPKATTRRCFHAFRNKLFCAFPTARYHL